MLQHEIPLDAVEKALDLARSAGAVSLLNTAPFRREAAPLLARADYVIANETEFDLYAGELALQGADRLARMRAFTGQTGRTIIVTLGGEGVIAALPGGTLEVEALNITPVDTVGAGDTFRLSGGRPLGGSAASRRYFAGLPPLVRWPA